MKRHRVVLDTNIFVSAMLSPLGNPAKIYRMFLEEMLILVYSTDIFKEYSDVLFRPRLHIQSEDAEKVLYAIHQYGEIVKPVASMVPLPDEADRIFYDVAKSAGARLVTGNIRHYPHERFILTPTKFLELYIS